MFSQYDDIITVDDLSAMLKIGRNAAYELVRAGIIPSIRVGRNIRRPMRPSKLEMPLNHTRKCTRIDLTIKDPGGDRYGN